MRGQTLRLLPRHHQIPSAYAVPGTSQRARMRSRVSKPRGACCCQANLRAASRLCQRSGKPRCSPRTRKAVGWVRAYPGLLLGAHHFLNPKVYWFIRGCNCFSVSWITAHGPPTLLSPVMSAWPELPSSGPGWRPLPRLHDPHRAVLKLAR